jgi:hypothetical protein
MGVEKSSARIIDVRFDMKIWNMWEEMNSLVEYARSHVLSRSFGMT